MATNKDVWKNSIFVFCFFFLKNVRKTNTEVGSSHQSFLCCWNFWALCSCDLCVVCVFCEQNAHKKLSSRSASRIAGEKEGKKRGERVLVKDGYLVHQIRQLFQAG